MRAILAVAVVALIGACSLTPRERCMKIYQTPKYQQACLQNRTAELSKSQSTPLPQESSQTTVKVVPKKSVPTLERTGTAFAVGTQGELLTNQHVIEGCAQVLVSPDIKVEVLRDDIQTDLALLRGPVTLTRVVAPFREGRGIRPGDTVVGAGYPLQGFLTSDLSITTGIVSALAGIQNDRRFMQISAPVQPGNSGGPLLDLSGNVVGIIVGKLDAIWVAETTGDIPQNVNFAINALIARAFLDSQGVNYQTAQFSEDRAVADIAADARNYTFMLECWK